MTELSSNVKGTVIRSSGDVQSTRNWHPASTDVDRFLNVFRPKRTSTLPLDRHAVHMRNIQRGPKRKPHADSSLNLIKTVNKARFFVKF